MKNRHKSEVRKYNSPQKTKQNKSHNFKEHLNVKIPQYIFVVVTIILMIIKIPLWDYININLID
ncbi:hypothetical protein D0856_09635 [Vibrio owensii]|nr:hypothetical protein D0856_09635 [Vibrio owensii]